MENGKQSAVLVTCRLVHAGEEERFARWADRHDEAARACAGGHEGLRLEQPNGLVHFVQRFDSEDAARRWCGSDLRRRLAAEADAFSSEHSEIVGGGRAQVRLPSEASVPKWKTGLATWLAVYPLLLAMSTIMDTVAAGLASPVKLAISSLILTATLTWLILPELRKRLRPWLFRDEENGGLKKEPG